MGIGGEEINLRSRRREGPQRLNGVEGEEDATTPEKGSDRGDVDPPPCLEVTRGKGHQTCRGGQGLFHAVRGDPSEGLWAEIPDHHT